MLIKNGMLLKKNQLIPQDIRIENQVIVEMAPQIKPQNNEKVLDASHRVITPGLVDLHVHYRQPGQTRKESIKTGSMSSAHGGFTTVGAMANVSPVPDNVIKFNQLQDKNRQDGVVHILQYAPVTDDLTSDHLTNFLQLKLAGAFALSNDGQGIQNAMTMYRAMKKAKANNMTLAAHVQDNDLIDHGVINQDNGSKHLGLKEVLDVSETAQLARDLQLAKETGVHYHVCHVSTKNSVELIRRAKRCGVHVTAEVTPHHLLLTDDSITKDDANYKMNPPLRKKEDQLALIAGLLDGTIDMIATDHAPHTKDEKQKSMAYAPFGIIGSETAFGMLYSAFVKPGIFTLQQLVDWLSIKPAEVFGLDCGKLGLNKTADIAIFDLNEPEKITNKMILSKGKNTPFMGQTMFASTYATIVSGKIVYRKDEIN